MNICVRKVTSVSCILLILVIIDNWIRNFDMNIFEFSAHLVFLPNNDTLKVITFSFLLAKQNLNCVYISNFQSFQ